MNKLSVFLIMLFLYFQYLLWFGKNGVCDWIYVHNSIKLYKKNNDIASIRIRNNQLLCEIYDLKYGLDSIEERARYELGMIQCGEVFYNLKL